MHVFDRKSRLLSAMGVSFAVVIGVSILAGRHAQSLAFLALGALGALGAALYGTSEDSKLRLPLFAISIVSALLGLVALFTPGGA